MYYILDKHFYTSDLLSCSLKEVLYLEKLVFNLTRVNNIVIILFLYGQDFGQSVDDFVKKLVEVLKECDDYDIKVKIICVSFPILPVVRKLFPWY